MEHFLNNKAVFMENTHSIKQRLPCDLLNRAISSTSHVHCGRDKRSLRFVCLCGCACLCVLSTRAAACSRCPMVMMSCWQSDLSLSLVPSGAPLISLSSQQTSEGDESNAPALAKANCLSWLAFVNPILPHCFCLDGL